MYGCSSTVPWHDRVRCGALWNCATVPQFHDTSVASDRPNSRWRTHGIEYKCKLCPIAGAREAKPRLALGASLGSTPVVLCNRVQSPRLKVDGQKNRAIMQARRHRQTRIG